jgi:competence protein ComEA
LKILTQIVEWLALTKTERSIILFLAVTMLAGAGIRLYQASNHNGPQFDYSASDSTFASLSSDAELNSESISGKAAGTIDINIATKQQLMDLPGIGEVTAERILKYREDRGKFTSVEGLRAIKGISRKKLEQLKPLITTQ